MATVICSGVISVKGLSCPFVNSAIICATISFVAVCFSAKVDSMSRFISRSIAIKVF